MEKVKENCQTGQPYQRKITFDEGIGGAPPTARLIVAGELIVDQNPQGVAIR
jgi:hypothetical protein